jgi:hypothetical protein
MILRRFPEDLREQHLTAMVAVVTDTCGDRPSLIRDFETIKSPPDYPCRTGLPDPHLARLLRLRIVNVFSIDVRATSDDVAKNMGKLTGNDQ